MNPIKQIKQIIGSTKLSKSKINLKDVERLYHSGHFHKGYKLKVDYTSSNDIKEIVLKLPSFEYIIYHYDD